MENFDSSNFKEDEIIFYMKEALVECENALKRGEVPVGCVFLHLPSMKIILRGHNLTNKTKNATTHAEINCIYYLFEILSNQEERLKFVQDFQLNESYLDVDKLKEIFSDCVLFVSCEPCIMCAYALNLVIYFGCENDKFGGTGSILSLNKFPKNSYQSEGGYLKQEAIEYFRKFYIRGNEKAPEHKRQRKLV